MRLPLATDLLSRDGTLTKDARLTNCFVEIKGDQSAIISRPGLSKAFDLTDGNGNGIICWKNTLYAVRSGTLAQGPTTAPVPDGSIWGQQAASATGTARVGHRIVSFNSKLWIMGGATAISGTLLTDVWSSSDGVTWSQVTASNFPARMHFGVAALGSKIYVYGGSNGAGTYYNSVYSSTDGDTWTLETTTPGWSVREQLGYCTFDSKMWAIGGFGGSALNDVWYSTNGQAWTQATATAAWSARYGLGVVVHNGKMFVMGGSTGTLQKDVYSSTDGITWTSVTSDWGFSARRGFGCVSMGNYMYVFGGDDGAPTLNDVYKSNPAGSSWSQVTSSAQWTGRGYFNAAVFGGTMFLYGGYRSTGTVYYDDVWAATINSPGGYTYTVEDVKCDFINTGGAAGTEYLVIKNTSKAWTLTFGSPGTLTQITDADYPSTTVPGIVYLDGYFFVMDANGVIYNSDLEAPASWNSLNFITAESEPDAGVAIAKHQNYVVALKSTTTELFYDAGNPTGSPLSPVSNAPIQIGCGNGYSLASIDGNLFFMSQANSQGKSVHMFPAEGMTPMEIASEDVKRILSASTLTTVRAFSMRMSGHSFYVLNLLSDGVSLVYDLTTKLWATWTYREAASPVTLTSLTQVNGVATATKAAHGFADGDVVTIAGATPSGYNITENITLIDADTFTYPCSSALATPATGTITATGTTETHFPFSAFRSCGGVDYIQHEDNGIVYEISPSYTDDDGQYIDIHARSAKLDNGTGKPKTIGQLEIIGDKVSATALIRYSDDDYATWSKYRPVDLSLDRPRLRRLGSFSRRAFELRFTDAARLRLAALETEGN